MIEDQVDGPAAQAREEAEERRRRREAERRQGSTTAAARTGRTAVSSRAVTERMATPEPSIEEVPAPTRVRTVRSPGAEPAAKRAKGAEGAVRAVA